MPQTAFGPLVEPGWPDLKGPDMGAKFLAGAAIGANINARTKALENQLALYALRAQGMEQQDAIREKQFELAQKKMELGNEIAWANVGISNQRVQGMLENQEALRQLASDKVEIAQANTARQIEDSRKKWERYAAQDEAKGKLNEVQGIVAGEGLTPGTEAYKRRILELTAPFAGSLPSNVYNAALRNIFSNSNAAWNQRRQMLGDQAKNLDYDLKNVVWGDGLTANLAPVLDPKSLPDETSTVGGHWWGGGETKPTGRKLVGQVKDAAGNVTSRYVPLSTLMEMNKRYNDLRKAQEATGVGINRPDLGVYTDHAETPKEMAMRALKDPEATPEEVKAAQKILQDNP